MRAPRVLFVASVIAMLASACNGGGSNSPAGGSVTSGGYAGHGAYINPIDFTVSNGVVSDVHGLVTLNCVIGDRQGSEDSQFHDADSIRLDGNYAFADDYHYKVGNGDWTLHVQGQLYNTAP